MRKNQLPLEMTDLLKESHFAYLCTTDHRNQPHITPMFFIFDELSSNIYITTSLKSKKMRNIRVNPNVSLAVDVRDPSNPFNNRGVMVQGIAGVKQLDFKLFNEETMKVYAAFNKKYPSLTKRIDAKIPYSISEALVRIKTRKLVYWRGPKFITVNLES